MSDEWARLFVALELPDAARAALQRWGEQIAAERPDLRLVRAEALHVTLCFLGSRPVGELPRIGKACEAVAARAAVGLSFGSALGLPPGGRGWWRWRSRRRLERLGAIQAGAGRRAGIDRALRVGLAAVAAPRHSRSGAGRR